MNKKNLEAKKYIVLFLFFLIIYVSIQYQKQYRSGDEVITYSMANSNFDSWMLPEGKTAAFLREEIKAPGLFQTAANIGRCIKDIVKNKREAEYFRYPQPEESHWFSSQDIKDWFNLKEDTRFNFLSVYYGGLIDADNPCFYPALVHLAASLNIEWSFSKWCAYSINIIALLGCFICLLRICRQCGLDRKESRIVCFIWGGTEAVMRMASMQRAYCVLIFWALLLLSLHLELLKMMDSGQAIPWKWKLKLLCCYSLGVFTQYLMAVFLCAVAISTFVYMFFHKERIRREIVFSYTATIIASVFLGFLLSPMFLKGIYVRFFGITLKSASPGILDLLCRFFISFTTQISSNIVIWTLLVVAGLIVIHQFKSNHGPGCYLYIKYLYLVMAVFIIMDIFLIALFDRYIWVIYPIVAIALYDLLYRLCLKHPVGGGKNKILIAILAAIYIVSNYNTVMKPIQRANIQWQDKLAVAKTYSGANCIYFILGGSGYSDLPLMENFENTLVVVTPDETLDEHLNDEKIRESRELILYIEKNAQMREDPLLELEDIGFVQKEILLDTGTETVYMLNR